MNTLEHQYINLESLKEDTLGDVEILRMVMTLFIEGIDEYVNIIKVEIEQRNWQALHQATHKIKSNIRMFGIFQLESIIIQLEHDFKNEVHLDQIDKPLATCLDVLKHVKTELRSELKTMQNE
ncbi:Hpt domain-containing protein [Flavobacteriaceae bacterium LMO-SS05]